MKLFICCSKHFYYRIPEIKERLKNAGHKITLPNNFEEPFKEEETKKMGKKEHIKFKQKMMMEQIKKIKKNEGILVLNFKKENIPNYIGGATFMEIIKAWELKKKIFLYNPIPRCSFTDELIGINPKVIGGYLELIN